jgi:hypothetical protein
MKPLSMKTILIVAAACFVAPLAVMAQSNDSSNPTDTTKSTTPSPVAVTGYVTSSYTYGTKAEGHDIVGRLYNRRHNEFMLNVADLTMERVAATDRMDGGFHFEGFFGQNAEVVKSAGLDLGSDADVWQAYVTLNWPLGSGSYLQFKGGKIATLMGVEVGEDVLNPNLDVGWQDILLEPFTETGAELDAKFGPHADAELRVTNGWDQVTDVNSGKTLMARLGLTPDDRTLIALVGYIGPEQAGNTSDKRSGANVVLWRKITPVTNAWLQFDYGQEQGIAANGADAKWYAAGLWLTYDVAPAATLAFRGDYLNDRDGARSSGVLGFPVNAGQKFGSATATLNIKSWAHTLVRPEIRYDHSNLPAFKGERSQISFGLGWSYIF